MKVLFALPGLHRYDRGAEIAFIEVARELAKLGHTITLMGSGKRKSAAPYRFLHVGCLAREKFSAFPSLPLLRNDYAYEELTFSPHFLLQYQPEEYDVTLSCSYPFTNWILRRPVLLGHRPPHVFVTENGDWPAYSNQSEYRFFGCEGLVCTNPDFYQRNYIRWRSRLIPNGVDCQRFSPGADERQKFGIPQDRLIVLMASALIESKRVDLGIQAVSRIPDAHLVVAGDGPLRQTIEMAATRLLPGRFTLLSVPANQMPALYRSANVFLHLSKEEAFGNVFLEAMATGLPIVAQDSARTRWIVGDDEYLVDTDQTDAISAAIITAVETPLVKQQQNRINKAALFSWTKIGAMYQDFLREIVSGWKKQ